MEYLHSNRVVHGDLRGVRPIENIYCRAHVTNDRWKANVLISREGVAKLSDFGLSKFLENVRRKGI
jgi:son of sevenless